MNNITYIPSSTIVEHTYHAISPTEIILVLISFFIASYWYITIRKDKEKYTRWTNPKGREVNLYKQVTILYWVYVATVIILGITQIILFEA